MAAARGHAGAVDSIDSNENVARALTGATCYSYALPTKTQGRTYRVKVQSFYKTLMASGESRGVTHEQALDAMQRMFPFYARELLETIATGRAQRPRKVGRKRVHKTNAARQKAYRKRQAQTVTK